MNAHSGRAAPHRPSSGAGLSVASLQRLVLIEGLIIFCLVPLFLVAANQALGKLAYHIHVLHDGAPARDVPAFLSGHALEMLGRVPDTMPMTPFDEPNVTQKAVLAWARTAVTDVMTIGFHNYDQALDRIRLRFTDQGWRRYAEALRKAGVKDRVVGNQQIVTAIPAGEPVIISQGRDKTRTTWQIQVPVWVNYAIENKSESRKVLVTLTLVRVPSRRRLDGVAIDLWDAR
ncbi:MAG: DotI/IcmL family type IV secretion protein [Alphaproteobacteria bacterium]|nr:MAG: DotI/IcmL family type IV secretion protein [Alphaproteobacteria bacterium]